MTEADTIREIAREGLERRGLPAEALPHVLGAAFRVAMTVWVRRGAWLIPPNDDEVRAIVDRVMETDEIKYLLRS